MKTKLLVALAAAGLGCAPDIQQTQPPSNVTTAVFDPTTGNIPLPNDLALLSPPATLPPAEQELLAVFGAQGGFPNDQEVPVTISFQAQAIGADGSVTTSAPDLDLTSFTPATLLVLLQQPGGAGTVALDPIQPADYVKGTTSGTLTLHNKGRQPWAPGEYVVAVRGGPAGVKAAGGGQVSASQVFYFLAQGEDLNNEQNLALLRAQTGSTAAAQALANQLDLVIGQYRQNGVYAAVNRFFPQQEMAVMTTFGIAPFKTTVELDPNRGLVPLPIDLLRDPRPPSSSCPACGKITPLAACTLANGTFNPATGACSSPAAAGFQALDGFSTSGLIISTVGGRTDKVDATTVTPKTVLLYDLSNPAAPALVDSTTYITEPAEVQQSGLSPAIALQPAGATAGDITSVFRTRPLKDNTMYAVVISDMVLDQTHAPLGQGTVASILQFNNPLVDSGGNSQLSGVDNATAGALEVMRQTLKPVLAAAKPVLTAALPGPGNSSKSKGAVAMAYTFKTQSILGVATQIGALPYLHNVNGDTTFNTGTITSETPAAAFVKYGVDGTVVPSTHISEIIETTITTFNLLDPASGAFNAAGTTNNEPINVLISVPKPGSAPTCAGPLAAFAPAECSPMVIFRHGLGGGRAQMLLIADGLNAAGLTVVAIDAAKHGDRSFCMPSGPAAQCPLVVNGAPVDFTCKSALPPGAQGDASPPGCCFPPGGQPTAANTISCGTAPTFQYLPVSSACGTPGACGGYAFTEGIPAVSAQYLVSANFFRTRDTLRQDIIDESQLVRAVAFVPTGPPPTGHTLFDHMLPNGVIINPGAISFVGQSLGAIQGTLDVATNPRIGNAVLNVGGGTVVDIFANSPAFVTQTDQLLATLGIVPGANSGYLQFLIVAKTILDPADPVNFGGHLTGNTLPNLLANPNGSVKQAAKSILSQAAFCDQTVPNPFNYILDATTLCETPLSKTAVACPNGPLPIPPPYTSTFGAGTGHFSLFYKNTGAAPDITTCPAPPTPGGATPGAVTHGFLTNWTDVAATTTAQSDASNFLSAGTLPPSLEVVP
jgi:hypothetical protein